MITAMTKPCFIIGNPVEHSKSPIFQNEAFKYYNIDSVYLALNVAKENLDAVVRALKCLTIFGLNVTIPYKADIMNYCDELSDDAAKIKAVNTIEIKEGKWIGHNTDWYGVYKTLEINKILKDINVLIIGSGGATNGVVYGLKKYGIKKITLTNRTREKALEIKNLFDLKLLDYSDYKKTLSDYDLIINTTSVEFGDLVDVFDDRIVYFDLKYYKGRVDTPKYIDGSLMLLYQGAKAFEIWTGLTAPVEVMKKILF